MILVFLTWATVGAYLGTMLGLGRYQRWSRIPQVRIVSFHTVAEEFQDPSGVMKKRSNMAEDSYVYAGRRRRRGISPPVMLALFFSVRIALPFTLVPFLFCPHMFRRNHRAPYCSQLQGLFMMTSYGRVCEEYETEELLEDEEEEREEEVDESY
jgi:hypothetical protein